MNSQIPIQNISELVARKVPYCFEKDHILSKCRVISNSNYHLSTPAGLEEVPSRVLQITDLVDLSLAGNRITSLPEGIKNLRAV